MAKVLIVEDSYVVALELESVLLQAGHRVVGIAPLGELALTLAARHRPAVAFVDLQLAGAADGIGTALQLAEQHGCAIIIASGAPAAVVGSSRIHDLPCAMLHKPFSEREILAALGQCLGEVDPASERA